MFDLIEPILPEIIVLIAVLAALTAGSYRHSQAEVSRIVLIGFALAFLALIGMREPQARLFFEKPLFVLDPFAAAMKMILLAAGMFAVAFGADWLQYKKFSRFEYALLIAFSMLGMMVAVSADSFLTQFLGLEALQMPLVFLTAYKRQGERSTEAGTKFVITALIGSGLWLFGVSVIYACLGTADFGIIAAADKTTVMPALLWGVSFIAAGFFIKIGAVPFHLWVPDVYEGAPSPVTAFFAMVVRVSVMAALARVVLEPFQEIGFYWRPVLSTVAVLSIFGGALGMLVQKNIKRFSAYMIIMANGFALSALAAQKTGAFVLFMGINTLLIIGLFGIILSLRVGNELSEEIRILNGQGQEKPVRGALFSLVFLGLLGLPPFAGFWARFIVWKTGFQNGLEALTIMSIIGSILPAYVFLKLIRQMYFVSAADELLPAPEAMKAAILTAAGTAVFLPFFLEPLGRFIERTVW